MMPDEDIAITVATCRTQFAAKFLVACALQYGSDDNASALIVPFGFWGKSFNVLVGGSDDSGNNVTLPDQWG